LDVQEFRPIKRSALGDREAKKLPLLVALGYLEVRQRPDRGENMYRLYWSRRKAA